MMRNESLYLKFFFVIALFMFLSYILCVRWLHKGHHNLYGTNKKMFHPRCKIYMITGCIITEEIESDQIYNTFDSVNISPTERIESNPNSQERNLESTNYEGIITQSQNKITYIPFSEFHYPLDVDMTSLVLNYTMKGHSDIEPINVYPYTYKRLPQNICENKTFLIFVIKSSSDHFERRQAIRRTWGATHREPNMERRAVFLLGKSYNASIKRQIESEYKKYNDIVQIDFKDVYKNNVLKTIGGIRWISRHCNNTAFVMFVDDDFFVSPVLVVKFLLSLQPNQTSHLFCGRQGSVFPERGPGYKWNVSFDEYPFDRYPPYVSAGAMIMSIRVVMDINIAIPFTKLFRFDDIYLAIIAYKLRITVTNNDKISIRKVKAASKRFKSTIASHGYQIPAEVQTTWRIHQKLHGIVE